MATDAATYQICVVVIVLLVLLHYSMLEEPSLSMYA